MSLKKRADALERLLQAERNLAAHRVLYETIEASPAFLVRLARSENEVCRLSAENDELRRELIRRDAPEAGQRQLRVL